MSLVEEACRRAVDAMTPAEKRARMVALNEWGRWNVARRITEEGGPLPAEELKWRIALSLLERVATVLRGCRVRFCRACGSRSLRGPIWRCQS